MDNEEREGEETEMRRENGRRGRKGEQEN